MIIDEGCDVIPLDELLIGDLIVGGGIIYKGGTLAGSDVDVHAQIATAPVDANCAVGKDGAVEGVVAKVAEVVGKEIVGADLEVVAQTG